MAVDSVVFNQQVAPITFGEDGVRAASVLESTKKVVLELGYEVLTITTHSISSSRLVDVSRHGSKDYTLRARSA